MRINRENNSIEMEPRDVNYILPGYVRAAQFHNQNKLPEEVVFPMFKEFPYRDPSTNKNVMVKIRWVEEDSEEAQSIISDGSNVKEAEVSVADEEELVEHEMLADMVEELMEEEEEEEEEDDYDPFDEEEVATLEEENEAMDDVQTSKPTPVPVEEPVVEAAESQSERLKRVIESAQGGK
jgi:cobalamin biosynthesis protein CobT